MTKASRPTEIADRRDGDRNACPLCNPKDKGVPADRLWAWSLANPGKAPLKR